MLTYAVLGSGSSGNSYVFSDGESSILIDQGYSVVELCRRLDRFGVEYSTLKAVCVTHLHPDHAKGVGTLARKKGLDVYLNKQACEGEMVQFAKLGIPEQLVNPITPFELIEVGPFSLFCFPTSHDRCGRWAGCALSGRAVYGSYRYRSPPRSTRALPRVQRCSFLRQNYDHTCSLQGPYPVYLKRRIDGRYGHLSNHQALSFLEESGFAGNHVYFIHMSDVNNDPALLEKAAHNSVNTPFTVCRKNQWYGPEREAK